MSLTLRPLEFFINHFNLGVFVKPICEIRPSVSVDHDQSAPAIESHRTQMVEFRIRIGA
jgi:hypothetical protein